MSKETRNDLRRYKANAECENYDEAIKQLLLEAADE